MLTIKALNNQKGAVLITTLSFMVLITLIGITAMSSSTNELRLASNYEDRISANHVSQAAIDATIDQENTNLIVTGKEGTVNNAPNFTGVAEFTETTVVVTEDTIGPPDRTHGVSAEHFSQVTFTIDSNYNGLAQGRGQANLMQGYIVLITKSSQSNQ